MNAELLDCTIRDGSYVIDGQWSKENVGNITNALSEAGIKYIEVGNGIGLGAHRKGVKSICTDLEYVQIASINKGDASLGAFFIPGIGTKEDIEMFAAEGGDFIRIGCDVSKSDDAIEYIGYAKSQNLFVGYNFMKSYVLSPFELCKRASRIASEGVDIIALVDSAGGMLPDEVGRYIKLLKETTETRIGFHGHNNLLLANANNIAALQNGADMIDTTLMGMGRGAGNAQTETMVVIMQKMGIEIEIDPVQLSKISKKYIQPLTENLKGSDTLQLVMGYAKFHSSFLGIVERYAKQYKVDYERIIIEVSKINKENPSDALIEMVAKKLVKGIPLNIFFPKFYHKEIK